MDAVEQRGRQRSGARPPPTFPGRRSGWQGVEGAGVRSGDEVVVVFTGGAWTVDSNRLPASGPEGYDAETEKQLAGAESCKVLGSAPFGALLVGIGGAQDPQVQVVSRRLAFRVQNDGDVALTINDSSGACSTDNQGSMSATVTITHTG